MRETASTARPLQAGQSNTCGSWEVSSGLSWMTLPTRYVEAMSIGLRDSCKRFPGLRGICDPQGKPFKLLAEQSGNPEITKLFETNAGA